jgi:hypothetical protein
VSARDELVTAIWSTETRDFGGYSQRDAEAVADELLAAGYSKPRAITNAEELDGLPDDSLIETRGRIVFQKYDNWYAEGEPGWLRPGSEWIDRTSNFDDKAHLPITVLYTPEATK